MLQQRMVQVLAVLTVFSISFSYVGPSKAEPLTVLKQGSFAAGGSISTTPGEFDNNAPTAQGQSLHGDHLYASYQVPADPRRLPIVMLHGAFVSGRSWESTLTVARASTLFFCVDISPPTLSISRGAGERATAVWR